MTVLMASSTVAMTQAKPTENTMEQCVQLLDYLATHADAKIRFYASDMIMNICSDVSYLSESKARSCACGHFFMGWKPVVGKPIKFNVVSSRELRRGESDGKCTLALSGRVRLRGKKLVTHEL